MLMVKSLLIISSLSCTGYLKLANGREFVVENIGSAVRLKVTKLGKSFQSKFLQLDINGVGLYFCGQQACRSVAQSAILVKGR